MRNVRDYGAVGDGVTLDTAAIQRAVDAGGMVYIPEGIYRIGTISLKSHGGLHLAPGAVLLGSHDRADYNADDFCPQNRVFTSEWVTGAHLITAVEQEDITIEGQGTINGEGHYWMNESACIPGTNEYLPNEERPGQMIFFCECKDIHVRDVHIVNGPYWHLFFHGCEDVFCRGLTIRGDRPRWTNDGIDLDCCKRVTVSDCVIDVGDDAIAIRGYRTPLLHSDGICEQITVTNCVLRADRDHAIRIGIGDGLIRNCILSNLDIEAPHYSAIQLHGRWKDDSQYSGRIENILFSNLNIRSGIPIEIFSANGESTPLQECYVRNVAFSNLLLFPQKPCTIRGHRDAPTEQISFHNVSVVLPAEPGDGQPVFSLEKVSDVAFSQLRVQRRANDGWGEDVASSESCRVTVTG